MAIGWRQTERDGGTKERKKEKRKRTYYTTTVIYRSGNNDFQLYWAWLSLSLSLDSLEPAPIELAINLSRLLFSFFLFSAPCDDICTYIYIDDIPIRLMNALC